MNDPDELKAELAAIEAKSIGRVPLKLKATLGKSRGQTTVFCRCPCPSAGCRYPHLSRERLREVVEVV